MSDHGDKSNESMTRKSSIERVESENTLVKKAAHVVSQVETAACEFRGISRTS